MSELNTLLELQVDLGQRMYTAFENMTKTGREKRTKGYLAAKRIEFQRYFQKLDEQHTHIYSIAPAEVKKSHKYFTEKWFDSVSENISKAEIKIEEWSESLVPGPTATIQPAEQSSTFTQQPQRTDQIRLPRIQIETFSGSYHKWIGFKNLFTDLVHNNTDISNVEKFHYLISNVSGDAKTIISHYTITSRNYESAWQTLMNRYDNKRALVNSEIKQLMNLTKFEKESAFLLRKMTDSINQSLHSLENLGIKTETWDPILIYIFTQKIDPETHRHWQNSISSQTEIPTVEEFLKFIENRFRTLENLQDARDSSTYTIQHYTNQSNQKKFQQNNLRSSPSNSTINNKTTSYKQFSNRPNESNLSNTASRSTNWPHNSPQRYNQQNNRFERNTSSFVVNNNAPTCTVCDESHTIFNCKRFADTNDNQKLTLINQKKLCTNCLGKHNSDECFCSKTCKTCNKRHHTLLHNAITSKTASHCTLFSSAEQSNTNVLTHMATGSAINNNQKQILLATALIKVVAKDGSQHTLRCLLDQGSQASFITTSAAQHLKITSTPVTATVTGLGATTASKSKALVHVSIQSIYNDFKTTVEALVLPKITELLPAFNIAPSTEWVHLNGLQLADPQYYKSSKIDMLLGADVYGCIILEGMRKGVIGAPIAQSTQLGWILSGQIGFADNDGRASANTLKERSTYNKQITSFHHRYDIDQQLKAFWELEELPKIHRSYTKEETDCEQFFNSTYKRDNNGRFIVGLPFKNERQQLGQSRHRALMRLNQLENKFKRQPEFKSNYTEVMEEYKSLDHMALTQPQQNKFDTYYMPHHAVLKASSTTTKLRVVFDASAKTTTGESLNDQLLVGPTLQPDLASILMRWQYRQIRVRHQDTRYQRILWSEENQIKEYELKTLTFGTSSAAYLAIKSLQQLAVLEKIKYPLASQIALNDFYVDDLLTGADTEEEAISIYNQISELLESGGFTLRKWVSNNSNVLQQIPEIAREIQLPLSLDKDDATKTLGMHYQPAIDAFQFKVHQIPEKKHTKRSLLSETAKLFDPLGLVSPVIIKSKIFLQRLWQQNYDWDQPITGELKNDWLKFSTELQELENIRIPRWLGKQGLEQQTQLHGFCDASQQAYAAVVYLRVINPDRTSSTRLITAKTRVAPIKTVTLPRLELCGAVLLSKLLTTVKNSIKLSNVTTYAWTDSEIVLAWLAGQPNRWKTFVANRIVEILEHTDKNQWRHIESKQNPADCASRGMYPAELGSFNLWWQGPEWIAADTWQLNKTHHDYKTEVEAKPQKTQTLFINANRNFIIDKFSSLSRLLRTIATIHRFMHNCKHPKERQLGPLTTSELERATNSCLRIAQGDFYKEIIKLENKQTISSKSRLLTLNPILDEHRILRVGGRIDKAQIPFNQRHPVILPSNHHFTTLVINDAHNRTLHGGVQLIITLTRKRYWILKSRNSVKRVINKCITCHRYRQTNTSQIMADLPKSRLEVNRPFTTVGIDYAGPIELRMSKGRGTKVYKGYISLFVCFSTKAIHLEIVSDLTTQAFLAALNRFVGRRGFPSHIYSDNGTNFIGADRIIQKLVNTHVDQSLVANEIALHGVEWSHIPARSPHHGGLWENNVKQMKRHLIRTIKNTTFTYEELSTITIQIEATLNSRPLTPLTDDPNDFSALTPGHFLIGNELLAPPTENLQTANISTLTKWRLLNKLHQHFWQRWSQEYITSLQQRYKWKIVEEDVKQGDMILLKEENQPPNQWKLGRITKLHPGDDGHVRVVTVNTTTGEYTRSITKIAILPIETYEEST